MCRYVHYQSSVETMRVWMLDTPGTPPGRSPSTCNLDALAKAGCGRIVAETASGASVDRPVLEGALDYVRSGETLVIWRLDRLGHSLKHLVEMVATLAERRTGFRSLTGQGDTTNPGGKLVFHVFGALVGFSSVP
jgi:DNA invertase Pin-like site-specific DNA recombinase